MSDSLQLKQRLKNIYAIGEITYAMQIVATVTIGRAQKLLNYSRKVQAYYDELYAINELYKKKMAAQSQQGWLIVFLSEKGFSGTYNQQLIPLIHRNNPGYKLILVGARGKDVFHALRLKEDFFSHAAGKVPTEISVLPLYEFLQEKKFPMHLKVITNKYVNMFVQKPKIVDFFPDQLELFSNANMTREISDERIDQVIIEKYVKAKLMYFFAQNFAGETAAKLLMMKNAVDSAKKLGDELALNIFKARQLAITQDLIEIISAFKVLRR